MNVDLQESLREEITTVLNLHDIAATPEALLNAYQTLRTAWVQDDAMTDEKWQYLINLEMNILSLTNQIAMTR